MTVPLPVPVPLLLGLNALASFGTAEAVAVKDSVISALTNHPFFKDIPLDPLARGGGAT
jgi:hypothetical protein